VEKMTMLLVVNSKITVVNQNVKKCLIVETINAKNCATLEIVSHVKENPKLRKNAHADNLI
jgi:hypothetical protein